MKSLQRQQLCLWCLSFFSFCVLNWIILAALNLNGMNKKYAETFHYDLLGEMKCIIYFYHCYQCKKSEDPEFFCVGYLL